MTVPLIRWFEDVTLADLAQVGGKNASLGEMVGALVPGGIRVPGGFAVTAEAYRVLLRSGGLVDEIEARIAEMRGGTRTLPETGETIRKRIMETPIPAPVGDALRAAYGELARREGVANPDVAVRSSATAEDLPTASFAGQQESFLNVAGEAALLEACHRCFASLFTDRAISYRESMGFDHGKVYLSVGVQRMVRSDLGAAGVAFTLDPDSGFPRVVVINGAWGLGETVVKGTVNPDQYTVFKPLLDRTELRPLLDVQVGSKERKLIYAGGDPGAARSAGGSTVEVDTTPAERAGQVLTEDEILELARWCARIEAHYRVPMDIEWAKDGHTGELFIVQARPETVQSREGAAIMARYTLSTHEAPLVRGTSVGGAVATGQVIRIRTPAEIDRFRDGAILVAERTDPDWGPILGRAAAVVTDQGGRTSHAAIVSRELGIPAVVGTGDGTRILRDGQEVTVSCAEGDEGFVYPGVLPFERHDTDLSALPPTRTRIMLNVGNPAAAFRWWRLPARGVGLARMEFIISEIIKVHPMALLQPERIADAGEAARIEELVRGYEDPAEYFVDRLARGIARIAAAVYPEPAIVRTSDFKTNEYASLLGGAAFEPHEENPMLGFRGACRYYSDRYRAGFLLECRALKRVRDEMGLDNVIPMIPFCRTPEEADRVLEVMAEGGLRRGESGLKVYVMCEVPSNVILAEEFAARFDGFSIGSNDLTQLILGVDRDSTDMAPLFDERNEAVTRAVADVIGRAHVAGVSVGICGQGPSDHPEFAEFLVRQGIDSLSLNPDSVPGVVERVAALEAGGS
jgi:pyruvate, water dikinase